MHHVAVVIGEHLHFDVPRLLDVFFQVDVAVAEGGFGLGPGLLQRRLQRQVVRARRACRVRRRRRPL